MTGMHSRADCSIISVCLVIGILASSNIVQGATLTNGLSYENGYSGGRDPKNQLPVVHTMPAVPYRSFADSPFAAQAHNSDYFYLETFEDGALNTPGIQDNTIDILTGGKVTLPDGREVQLGGIAVVERQGEVRGPGSLTDSIDFDDGSYDGSGNHGHSYHQHHFNAHLDAEDSISYVHSINFCFKENDLGTLPNAFGFAWTDGEDGGTLSVLTVDSEGAERRYVATGEDGLLPPITFGDSDRDGGTAEDLFVHLTTPTDIEYLSIQYKTERELQIGPVITTDTELNSEVEFDWG